jgi:hypothetical protein
MSFEAARLSPRPRLGMKSNHIAVFLAWLVGGSEPVCLYDQVRTRKMATILTSRNTDYGFYGTITTTPLRDRTSEAFLGARLHRDRRCRRLHAQGRDGGRARLSRLPHGRPFADEVIDRMARGTRTEQALDETIAQWVQHFAICAEAEGDAA